MRQLGTEGWRTTEAHTPGQNMLVGMSGHDSGRLVTSSRSGKQRQPRGCFSKLFFLTSATRERGDATFPATHTDLELRKCKLNQMQGHYFTTVSGNPHRSINAYACVFFFFVSMAKMKNVLSLSMHEKEQNRVSHV